MDDDHHHSSEFSAPDSIAGKVKPPKPADSNAWSLPWTITPAGSIGTVEQHMHDMGACNSAELGWEQSGWKELQRLLASQSSSIQSLELDMEQVITDKSALYREQMQLRNTLNDLLTLCSKNKAVQMSLNKQDEQKKYRDCAELFRAGFNKSGIYTIYISMQDMHKGFLLSSVVNMYAVGVLLALVVVKLFLRRRKSVLYTPPHWLFLKSYSGMAGRQKSLAINGAGFSAKDMDNDNCICKCAIMLTGGWWFDACGPSNLNGMYYTTLDAIKWHYFKGPNYSLYTTTMMIRPLDF